MDPRLFASVVSVGLGIAILLAAWRPVWVVGHPRSVLLTVVVVSLAALTQLAGTDPLRFRLRIDPSTEPLLPVGDPAQALYDSAVRDFGDDEVYVIAAECEEVFTADCLGLIQRVSAPIARLHGVRSLASLLDVTSFRYVESEDWIEVRPFIEKIPEDPAELADLRARALADPVYRRTLVSDSSRAAAINIGFRKMTNAELIERDLDGKIRAILAAEPDRVFYVSGRPHFKTHVYHGMKADLILLIPLGVLVMAVVLWIFTGSWRGVVLPLSAALLAILWTQAAMVVTDTPLNLLTVLLAPMFLAIGSVYVVHVLSRLEEDAAEASSVEAAVLSCMEHIVVPVLIAGLTTLVSFAALLLTDVTAVFELGLLAMLGIASITLLTLTAVPAALVLMPLPASATERVTLRARIGGGIDRVVLGLLEVLSRLVARHAVAVLAVGAVLSLMSVAALPRIAIDTDYLSYFDPEDPVRKDFEAVNRHLAGAVPLFVVIDGGEPGTFREPEVLRSLVTLQERIDALPRVSRTLSFIDSLRKLNRAFGGDDPAQERIPDTRGGVTELLFMLPKGEMSRYLTINHGRANIVVRTGAVGSAEVASLVDEIEGAIAETPLPHGLEARVTGNALLLARSADGIARSQPWSVGLAAVAIFLLITVGLRSPQLGAVAMLPNVVPVLLFFGLLGMGAAPLSLPTSLIACISLGIAIDDSVHFLVRYRGERRAGCDPLEAARRCGRRVGRPIVITSVMLVAGFMVMGFSEFATLQEFGVLTAATMALCLFADLMLLPAILTRARI